MKKSFKHGQVNEEMIDGLIDNFHYDDNDY